MEQMQKHCSNVFHCTGPTHITAFVDCVTCQTDAWPEWRTFTYTNLVSFLLQYSYSSPPHEEGDKHAIKSIKNQSIKTHFYSAICHERIRGA